MGTTMIFFLLLLVLGSQARRRNTKIEDCKYSCEPDGGCGAKYIYAEEGLPGSGRRSGARVGSCLPLRLGGRCSGSPPQCQSCHKICASRSSQELPIKAHVNPYPRKPPLYQGSKKDNSQQVSKNNGIQQGSRSYGGYVFQNPMFQRNPIFERQKQYSTHHGIRQYSRHQEYSTHSDIQQYSANQDGYGLQNSMFQRNPIFERSPKFEGNRSFRRNQNFDWNPSFERNPILGRNPIFERIPPFEWDPFFDFKLEEIKIEEPSNKSSVEQPKEVDISNNRVNESNNRIEIFNNYVESFKENNNTSNKVETIAKFDKINNQVNDSNKRFEISNNYVEPFKENNKTSITKLRNVVNNPNINQIFTNQTMKSKPINTEIKPFNKTNIPVTIDPGAKNETIHPRTQLTVSSNGNLSKTDIPPTLEPGSKNGTTQQNKQEPNIKTTQIQPTNYSYPILQNKTSPLTLASMVSQYPKKTINE